MKTTLFQKLLCVLTLLFALSAGQPLKAQWVVYDPAQFANMIKSLANEVQLLTNTANTLQETRNILNTAIRTKEEIENIYSLQWQVQEALKMARSVSNLKWSDLDGIAQDALGLSVDPTVYLPRLPETNMLRYALQLDPNVYNSRLLYSMLVGINASSEPLEDIISFDDVSRQAALHQFAVAEMRDQKKIQTALSYNQLADEMISQARELMDAVKRDQQFKMTEAERLSTLKQCQDVLVKSMEMKLEADELLRSITENPSRSRNAMLQSYRNQLVRKALAEEPQMKYGR